jgi:hypothetical protein
VYEVQPQPWQAADMAYGQPLPPSATPPQSWPGPPQHWPPHLAPPGSGGGNNTAALALSICALAVSMLTALGVLAFAVLGGFAGDYTLEGSAPGAVAGEPYDGDRLAAAATAVIERDYGTVEELDCPDTEPVAAGVVTRCTGVVDDWDTVVTIIFEDDGGSFTLLERDA